MTIIIEKLIANAGSKYSLTSVCAKRAKEINGGAKILSADVSGKPDAAAMREINEGKIIIGYRPKEPKTLPVEQAA